MISYSGKSVGRAAVCLSMLPMTECYGAYPLPRAHVLSLLHDVQGSPDWEVRGALGNRWLFVLRELLQLLPSWDSVRADVRRFLEAAQQASQASVSMIAGVISNLPCIAHRFSSGYSFL